MKFRNKRTGIIENVSLPELFQQYLNNSGVWERIEEQKPVEQKPIIKKSKKGK